MQDSQENLSHLNQRGEVQMVDVSGKASTLRVAVAVAEVKMSDSTLKAIESGNAPKGDVLATARIAGIMAAKQTSALIPLCHPLAIQKVEITLTADYELPGYKLRAEVMTKGETGVEMEALTAVSVAALTLYDMAKALQKGIEIGRIRLMSKTGGKSGDYERDFGTLGEESSK
ncbi:MAG: Cyclic pyranopterin monophosphate synthase [Chroococcopsis gigantea SAG 12.99]|jgi:cyclic pyranopterin phosphate synthase|nr:Cyclic pyranopterin monophosphate synthase [Chroococcopsis gigantea SAG 12.99]